MAANVQRGTTLLSAGDWIRLKRLSAGGKNFQTDKDGDITNPSVVGVNAAKDSGRQVYPSFGTSKYRRPASYWTDYIASQTADYVTSKNSTTNTNANVLTKTIICDCTSSTLTPKKGLCMVCIKNFNNVR